MLLKVLPALPPPGKSIEPLVSDI